MKRKIILAVSLGLGIATGAWLALHGAKRPQPAFLSIPLPPAPPAEPVTFYRWQDDKGVSVLSSERPPPGVTYTTTTMDGVLTTMERPKPVEIPSKPEPKPADQAPNPLSVYTPGGMQQLIQQAKQAKQAVEQSQQRTINQIESQR